MLLDLSKIRAPHTAIEEAYAPDLFRTVDDVYAVTEPVRLHVDVFRTGERFRLAASATRPCDDL